MKYNMVKVEQGTKSLTGFSELIPRVWKEEKPWEQGCKITSPRNNEQCFISVYHRNHRQIPKDIVFFVTKYSYLPKYEVFLFE